MATCSVIDKAFNDLWAKGVLKEGKTKIQDLVRFENLNESYTNIAKSKYGVTNPGQMFNVNTQTTSHTGPLNLYSHKGANAFENQFAVINKDFADEFQNKFEKVNKLEDVRLVVEPAEVNESLLPTYNKIKNIIEASDYSDADKAILMNQLNESRSPSDFGELIKKLC
jgi:hypothetical protein